MDEYKKLAAAIENDMSKQLKQHEKNPEKHPQYNDEWKQFWNRRYKELQAEGKDPNKHDFKPEWILFWNKRMLELHNNDVKAKKDALRRRLGLPEEPAPICFKITGKKKPVSGESKPKPMAASPDADPEIIVIDDKEDDSMSGTKRSRSPWENEATSRRSRSHSRSRSLRRERSKDRTRGGSRERVRGGSRDRLRDGSKERMRERSRERERLRLSRERTRERSKDRSRERSRGRSRDRYGRGASWDREHKYYDYEYRLVFVLN